MRIAARPRPRPAWPCRSPAPCRPVLSPMKFACDPLPIFSFASAFTPEREAHAVDDRARDDRRVVLLGEGNVAQIGDAGVAQRLGEFLSGIDHARRLDTRLPLFPRAGEAIGHAGSSEEHTSELQ